MALTRDQFDVIANSYNDRQLNNKIKLNRRIEEVYEKIPLIKDLDGQIGFLAGRALRLSLSGNSSAKDTLREDIALISEQKKAALLAGGYSADYLDEIFTCPKCKDTGFIDGKPCECLKAEVVRLLIPVLSLRRFLNARTLILLNMICILMTTLIPIQGFPQQKILTLLWTIVIIL